MDEHHSVAAAVLVDSNRVLLCHRHPDRQWYPNVWDIPGGHIDEAESPAEAVRRELLEELGVSIRIDGLEPFRIFAPASDLTVHTWVVTEWSGDIANLAPDEHDEICWFELDDLAQLELADELLRVLLVDAIGLAPDQG